MPARRKRFLTYCLIVAASLMLLVYIVYKIAYNYPKLSDLAPLPLAGHTKLLMLAPHCDDEVLGAAGAMLAAERLGMDVRVVIATNGDGYQFATMEEFRQAYPTAEDFIRMGNLRQQESLDALQVLGIQPEQVIFLSYPDRGSAALLSENWQRDNPYLSPYSESWRSPYWITYNPISVYAGEDYLADLKSIMDEYRPDLILYPHPDDMHGDHWGLGALARLAAASLQQGDARLQARPVCLPGPPPRFSLAQGLQSRAGFVAPPPLVRGRSGLVPAGSDSPGCCAEGPVCDAIR